MSILTNADERADWLARSHSLIRALQALETLLSVAMLDRPTGQQAIALMAADQQLGIAATAITEASAQIRGLK
jgi:hypothetical protein